MNSLATRKTPRPSKRSLRQNQDGAIMVMGLFMAVILVGFLYFTIGIGETIFYRERMQDASDSGAWAAAVTHARGMNAIVMINFVMAAIVAVLLALKILLFLIDVGLVISAIACAIPWTAAIGCPAQSFLQGLRPTVKTAHDAVQRFADATLPLLNKAATAVQRAMPYLAEARVVGLSQAGDFNPPVSVGIFYSKSLYQGLPVEDDDCDVLVEHAQEYLRALVMAPFGNVGGPVGWILGKIIGMMSAAAQAVEGSICGGGAGGGIDGSQLATDFADQQLEEHGCNGDDPPSDCPDELPDTGGAPGADAQGGLSSSSNKSPKRVLTDAYLGDENFQIRAIMVSNDGYTQMMGRTLQGAEVATWGRQTGSGETYSSLANLGRGSVAQAEYYWDSRGEGDGQAKRDEWMWAMNWRARMRRFRLPTDSMLGSVCGSGGGGTFCSALSGGADLLNGVFIH